MDVHRRRTSRIAVLTSHADKYCVNVRVNMIAPYYAALLNVLVMYDSHNT